MHKLLFVACLIGLSAAGPVPEPANKAKINYMLDYQLSMLNKVLPASHALPDFEIQGVTGKGVSISKLNTQRRIGDVYVWTSADNTIYGQATLGIDMTLQIDELTHAGTTAKAAFNIVDNEFTFLYSTHFEDNKCTLTLFQFEFTKLDKVTAKSDDPDLDGKDVSGDFAKYVLPYWNKMARTDKVLDVIKKNVPCDVVFG